MKEYLATPEGQNQKWEKVNEILDNFDFSKVYTVMEALDWTWVCTSDEAEAYADEGCRVVFANENGSLNHYRPDIKHLMIEARRLLLLTIDEIPDGETAWGSATGGFTARVVICSDDDVEEYYGRKVEDDFEHRVCLSLKFVVEEWRTE